jgi:hypothetical protein
LRIGTLLIRGDTIVYASPVWKAKNNFKYFAIW